MTEDDDRPGDAEGVEAMERLLAREAAERRRVLEEIAREEPTAEENEQLLLFRARIRRERETAGPAVPARRDARSSWRWLAAAVVLLAGSAWLASHDPGRVVDPGRLKLGSDQVACDRPVGRVPRYESFQWRFDDLPATASYELTVRDASDGHVVLRRSGLIDAIYRPTADERAALPDAIAWRVRVLEAGVEIGSGEGSAARR